VITYVIDYIQDLSETLGLPPSPSSLPSGSSDEEDEDEDEYDMEDEEEISSKVTLSLINKKSSSTSFSCNGEPVALSHSRQPLSVIPNPDKIVKGGQ